MSVLVTTVDGYRIFTSSGKQLRSLEGHRVECFTPGPDGTFVAVIDRHEVWSHGSDGEWTPLTKSESTLTAVVARSPDNKLLMLSLIAAACSLIKPTESVTDKQEHAARLARDGKVKPAPIETRPLETAQQSLDDLRAGHVRGRIVLTL